MEGEGNSENLDTQVNEVVQQIEATNLKEQLITLGQAEVQDPEKQSIDMKAKVAAQTKAAKIQVEKLSKKLKKRNDEELELIREGNQQKKEASKFKEIQQKAS